MILDRTLPAEVRELNLARFLPEDAGDPAKIREAIVAMPFLAERRVVVVSDAQSLRAEQRRSLWEIAQEVPEGNTLVILDLLSPRSARPQSFGSLAGRAALRVDTTADHETRARYVQQLLERLGAKAEPRVVDELTRSKSGLAAVRNDLEKLALTGKKITFADLEAEALSIEDPKPYQYASAVVEGRVRAALDIADEFFTGEPRAAVALLSALATECDYVWELARPGRGALPERLRFREPHLRPLARRIGEQRSRRIYEEALKGLEAAITGRVGDSDEQRAFVDRITVELSTLANSRMP